MRIKLMKHILTFYMILFFISSLNFLSFGSFNPDEDQIQSIKKSLLTKGLGELKDLYLTTTTKTKQVNDSCKFALNKMEVFDQDCERSFLKELKIEKEKTSPKRRGFLTMEYESWLGSRR